MESPRAVAFRGYAAAITAVLAAHAATYVTWPLLQPTPLALFYAAVLAGAWLGGARSGGLAVALSAVLGHYQFFPPYGAFGTDPSRLVALAVFVLVASA